jgi:ATP-binding cassette subfamily F protein 3
VFISHDVHFIKALANKVLHVAGGVITPYLGDYQFYLHKTKAESARAALTAGGAGGKSAPKAPGGAAKPSAGARPATPAAAATPNRNELQKQLKKLQQVVTGLEREIETLEARKAALAKELEDPALWRAAARADQAQREFSTVTAELRERTAAWERDADRLHRLQAEIQ